MYSDLLNFKDIHVFSKVFAFIFCILGIFMVEKPICLILFSFLFYIFFRRKEVLFIELVLIGVSFLFPIFIPILKFCFFISVLLLFISTIDFHQFRYFLESLFYKRKQTKVTYFALYICYFFQYYKQYFKEYLIISKSYGKTIDFNSLRYILIQSFEKTKCQLNHILVLYRYRFYNSSITRTYVEKEDITSVDLKYILIFVIIFFLIYVYGR